MLKNQQELFFGSKNNFVYKKKNMEKESNCDLFKDNFNKNYYESSNISLDVDL